MQTNILTCATLIVALLTAAVSPNLLQGGTASQSTTYSTMIADRAVDGNLEIMSVTLTDPSPFAYWSYQMPATCPVNTLFLV